MTKEKVADEKLADKYPGVTIESSDWLTGFLASSPRVPLVKFMVTRAQNFSDVDRVSLWNELFAHSAFDFIGWHEKIQLLPLIYQWGTAELEQQTMLRLFVDKWHNYGLTALPDYWQASKFLLQDAVGNLALYRLLGTPSEVRTVLFLLQSLSWVGQDAVHWANLVTLGYWDVLDEWLTCVDREVAIAGWSSARDGLSEGFNLLSLPAAGNNHRPVLDGLWCWLLKSDWRWGEAIKPPAWGDLWLAALRAGREDVLERIAQLCLALELNLSRAYRLSQSWDDQMVLRFLKKRSKPSMLLSPDSRHDLAFRPKELLASNKASHAYLMLLANVLTSGRENQAALRSGVEVLQQQGLLSEAAWMQHAILRNQGERLRLWDGQVQPAIGAGRL